MVCRRFVPVALLLLVVHPGCRRAPAEVAAAGTELRLEFVADFNVPSGTDFEEIGALSGSGRRRAGGGGSPTERKASGAFGGISALAWDADAARLLALSDSTRPVVFSFALSVDDAVFRLTPLARIELAGPGGEPIDSWSLDPEGMARDAAGRLFVSSEGFPQRAPPIEPALLLFAADGKLLGELPLDAKFLPPRESPARRGVRPNEGFESLALSPDGGTLFVANEGPLEQDGPACAPRRGCVVRIIEYALASGKAQPLREYAYALAAAPVPADFHQPAGSNGLVELLHLGDLGLLALERAFVTERGGERTRLRVRLYLLDLEGATDVAPLASLAGGADYRPVAKRLVLDLDDIVERLSPGYRSLDNFEGMCTGPALADGSRSLILVSDDNYSDRQRTAFLLFRMIPGGPATRP